MEDSWTLFREIEEMFPVESSKPQRWEILVIASVTASGAPHLAGELYQYLLAKPLYESSDQRRALIARLREALFKLVCVSGIPRPLEAIFSIAALEKEEDKDYECSRENWQPGPENAIRARQWIDQLYQHNHGSLETILAGHKDFAWLSIEVNYGLFLSDHRVLDAVDTEIVVLSGLLAQRAKRELAWHLRGTRRIGVSSSEVENIQQAIEKVVSSCGIDVSGLPRVSSVEQEV